MKWLLDTNVVSETIGRVPNPTVVAWIGRQPRADLAISIVTLAELRDGASSAPEDKRAALTQWIEESIVPSFEQRILPLSGDILIAWLRLSRRLAATRSQRRAADLLIAATARVNDLTVVTRNVRDYAQTGITVYDPWSDRVEKLEAI